MNASQFCQSSQLWTLLCILLLLSTAAQAAGNSTREPCRSLECVTIAASMASMMNQSANPCEDFYSYACGNFPNVVSYNPDNVKPYKNVKLSLFEDTVGLMVDRVEKKIYELLVLDKLAVDRDPDIQDLYNLTRLYFLSCTQWMQGSEWESSKLSVSFMKGIVDHLVQGIEPTGKEGIPFERVLAAIVRTGGNSLITLRLHSDLVNTAFQTDMNLTSSIRATIMFYKRDWLTQNSPWYGKYVDFVRSKEISRFLNLDNAAQSFTNITLRRSLLKLEITETVLSKCANESVQNMYSYSLEELDTISACIFPKNTFSWRLFFEELLQSPVDPTALVELTDPPWIITTVNYFKSQSVYSEDGKRFSEHTSYLIFDWLMSFADFLPKELRQSRSSESGYIKSCMSWTKYSMQPILERMYRAAYHPKGFGGVKNLIHLIKKASIDSVRRQSWIKASGREAIVDKIRWVRHNTGLSEVTAQQMKSFYNKTLAAFRACDFSSSELQYHFGTLTSIVMCANARKNFELIGGTTPVTVFTQINPLEVNAYNSIETNKIIFPMAILEPPEYHPSYPGYINLGGTGYTIGHEIGHSFDNAGHELNRRGAAGHFWDNETEAAYLDRMECVRSSYGNYTLFPGGPKCNANTTLGNDIADIMGLKAAYGALQILKRSRGDSMPDLPNLQLGLNHDQLFFVRAAQAWCTKVEKDTLDAMLLYAYRYHSPNHLRVLGMMQNSWEFAQTFQCKLGQGMHPKEKCTFW